MRKLGRCCELKKFRKCRHACYNQEHPCVLCLHSALLRAERCWQLTSRCTSHKEREEDETDRANHEDESHKGRVDWRSCKDGLEYGCPGYTLL